MCPCVPDRIGIWKCWFLRRGENRSTQRRTFQSKGENQQQTQPTYGVDAGSQTRGTLVLWEVSALTTAHPLLPQIFNANCSRAMLAICTFAKCLRKHPTFGDVTSGSPAKWCLRNECRNSILMIYLYLDLGSASDWLKICFKQSDPLVTQIWVVTCHKYGISVLVPRMSLPKVGCFQVFSKCRGLKISYLDGKQLFLSMSV